MGRCTTAVEQSSFGKHERTRTDGSGTPCRFGTAPHIVQYCQRWPGISWIAARKDNRVEYTIVDGLCQYGQTARSAYATAAYRDIEHFVKRLAEFHVCELEH